MVLATHEKNIPYISNTFRAEIYVFSGHHTTIKNGFNALCNIGNIKSAAIFKLIDNDVARSGDVINVQLKFKNQMCPLPNSEFIFREGVSVGYGRIIEPFK
jgi:GTPase